MEFALGAHNKFSSVPLENGHFECVPLWIRNNAGQWHLVFYFVWMQLLSQGLLVLCFSGASLKNSWCVMNNTRCLVRLVSRGTETVLTVGVYLLLGTFTFLRTMWSGEKWGLTFNGSFMYHVFTLGFMSL